jgi:ribosomal protein L40E
LSHSKERAEKVCLNCGADLHGRYCHSCGQENLEPKESLWGLITHYAYDITHFDGKFFNTLKYLILRPGFLPAQYLKGKRMSYLHPIRMYVFTSAFFFIIFFSLFHFDHLNVTGNGKWESDSLRLQKIEVQKNLLAAAETKKDSARIKRVLNKLESIDVLRLKDSTGKKNNVNVITEKANYKTVEAYDSAQQTLPKNERDGWVKRRIMRRSIVAFEKYNGDVDVMVSAWLAKFTHSFPQLLFISLLPFAFMLWLLYIRRNDQYYYTGHVIFTLYLYIFYFIAYLLFFGMQQLHDNTGWGLWGWLEAALWIYMIYYMYKAMRNFYGQRRFKTFVKLTLLTIATFFIILFLFILFVIFSAYQI